MANYKEIVTKAIIAKGKKSFTTTSNISVNNNVSTILGCWIINHNFNGVKSNNQIIIDGSYDVNIWYSYDNDTKTEVVRETNNYREIIKMRNRGDETGNEEIIVRSLRQPNCVKVDIIDNKIEYVVEKELGIELVDDVKVKIETSIDEDPWDEIVEESNNENIEDNYINEETI